MNYVLLRVLGVFNPVEALPGGLQPVAQLLPSTHASARARAVLDGKPLPGDELAIGALAALVWLVGADWVHDVDDAGLPSSWSGDEVLMKALERVVLEGRFVRLEPFDAQHLDELWSAGRHPEIWTYFPASITSSEALAAAIAAWQHDGLTFVTISRDTDQIIGSTSFLNPVRLHRRIEIGATWLTPPAQRSAANTEAKLLQLTHAFEALECVRVEFKTDARNSASRAALVRLGAAEEGTHRKHMRLPDGTWRDSAWFSVLDTEWPKVKADLEAKLER